MNFTPVDTLTACLASINFPPNTINTSLTPISKFTLPPAHSADIQDAKIKLIQEALIAGSNLSPASFKKYSLDSVASIAAQLLESAPAGTYLYTTRKTTQIPYKIIMYADKSTLLFQPRKSKVKDEDESGADKVGRRAISLVKDETKWTASIVYTLTSIKNKHEYKHYFTYENKAHIHMANTEVFAKHHISFTFPAKAHKRLGVYENMIGSLFEWIIAGKNKHLNVQIATDLANKLCRLHQSKRLHGDIKAENILVGENATVKLCDLDFSRGEEEHKTNPCTGGTLSYLSPERVKALKEGKVFTGDPFASETYSLAVIFYVMHFELFPESAVYANPPIDLDKMLEEQMKMAKDSSDAAIVLPTTPKTNQYFLMYIALWMLHPNPALRPTIQAVCKMLSK